MKQDEVNSLSETPPIEKLSSKEQGSLIKMISRLPKSSVSKTK